MSLLLESRLREAYPALRVTPVLIALNGLVFVAMLLSGAGLWHSPNGVQLAWGANFAPATQDGEWWRIGTALFLHFGLVHLGLNMWALWDGGQWVERMFGPLRFTLLYFAAGLTGNLFSMVFQQGQPVAGGASGAIFGIYGALLAYLWLNRRHLQSIEFRWLFLGALGFSALTIVFGLLIPGIDNAAHIGGLITGGGLGAWLLSRQKKAHLFFAVGFALLLATLLTHLPTASYRWYEEKRVREELSAFLREDAVITFRWNRLLNETRQRRTSFEDLANRLENEVIEPYAKSFSELSALPDNDALPSADRADLLRQYAEQRLDASRELAQGLRNRDGQKIQEALKKAQQATRTD